MRRRTTLLVAGDAGQRLHLATLIGPDLTWRSICGAERWQGGVDTGDAWEHLAFDKPLCRRCAGRLEELVALADLATSVQAMASQRLRVAAVAARGHGSASVTVPVSDLLAALDQTGEPQRTASAPIEETIDQARQHVAAIRRAFDGEQP